MIANTLARTLAGVALSLVMGGANAALYSADGGLAVYDSNQNITWLANADLAATNTFGVSPIGAAGYMSWLTAQAWIAAMNTAGYLGVSDWRLPNTTAPDPTCSGQNNGQGATGSPCTGSEMGHLFYAELGGVTYQSIITTHNASYSLFQNVPPDSGYWSGTEVISADGSLRYAYWFNFSGGVQGLQSQGDRYSAAGINAWPVAPGNPFNAVPVPPAAWLFSSALAALGWVRRRTVRLL